MSRFSLLYKSAIVGIFFAIAPVASAATLSLSPASVSVSVGETFTASVLVSSTDQAMNAVEGIVSFPEDLLSVVSVGKGGSIIGVWVQEPRFSNPAGTVNFEGVITNPGYQGPAGRIVSITFRAKAAGTATLQFLSSSVLANDGNGSNILQSTGKATYVIGAASSVEEEPEEEPTERVTDSKKPTRFDIEVIGTDDLTNPRVALKFIARDAETGIHHYEVTIDGEKVGDWKDPGNHIYYTPALTPGTHSVFVKAFDFGDNYLVNSVDVTVDPLQKPVITYYTDHPVSGDYLLVKGESCPVGGTATIIIEHGSEKKSYAVACDKEGTFTFVSDTKVEEGVYKLSALVNDKRGAQSEATAPITILVRRGTLEQVGYITMQTLMIFIPVIALLILLIALVLYGWRWIMHKRKQILKESEEAEKIVHKAFALLQEDVKDSVVALEKAQSSRELTKEEEKVMVKLKRNLSDAEKAIQKEVHDVTLQVTKKRKRTKKTSEA